MRYVISTSVPQMNVGTSAALKVLLVHLQTIRSRKILYSTAQTKKILYSTAQTKKKVCLTVQKIW